MVAPDNVFGPRSQNYVWRRVHVFMVLAATPLQDVARAKLKDDLFVMKVRKVVYWMHFTSPIQTRWIFFHFPENMG